MIRQYQKNIIFLFFYLISNHFIKCIIITVYNIIVNIGMPLKNTNKQLPLSHTKVNKKEKQILL